MKHEIKQTKTLMGWGIILKGRKPAMLPEGPWSTQDAAQDFLNAEVGVDAEVVFMLFAQGDYVWIRSNQGQQWMSPNGECFTAKRIRVEDGWSFAN